VLKPEKIPADPTEEELISNSTSHTAKTSLRLKLPWKIPMLPYPKTRLVEGGRSGDKV
jgi:hypothetical protein